MTRLRAPAKLTWYLEVTARRDDGRHDLRSEMCTLDLADELEIDETGDYLELTGRSEHVALDETNLVRRALDLVERRAGVRVHKSIPAGGGLGGGSADAAAILRWAGGVSPAQAVELGGDVPFCQLGGRALVEGVGEVLTPLEFAPRPVTVILTGLQVDTAQCYRAFDQLVDEGLDVSGRNELTRAAFRVAPRLAEIARWVRAEFAVEPILAGSGSTLFVEGHVAGEGAAWDVASPVGSLHFRHCVTTPAPG